MSFEFEYPYAFLLIVIYIACVKFCKPKALALIFPNASLFKKVSKKSSILKSIVKFLAFLFLVIALASPIKKDEIALHNQKGYEIALILDASGSMRQNGKFRAVKEIVTNFIKKRKNDKIGLTIFADFAYVAVPLTYDKKSLLRLLSKIDVGIAGLQRTALYEALFLSTRLFKNSKAKEKIAILLTDGMDNTNSIPLNVAINTAKKYGIRVYTIGVGSGRDFNPQVLQEIANQTGGKYYNAQSKQELIDIYNQINSLEKSEFKAQKYIKKSYYYQYFLAFGVLFLIIYAIGYRR
jgi:Ca-activated chloride channel family protein